MLKASLKLAAFCVVIAIAAALLSGFTRNEISYRVETYTVTDSDKLQTIAERFIKLNTGTVRKLKEFEEGIREANYSLIGDGEVKEGQVLQIGYWTKNKGR